MGIRDWLSKKEPPVPSRPFHITIGAASEKGFDLQNDLRMLRSALIYADKVKLCSTSMSHMYSILGYSKDIKSFVDFLEQVTASNTTEENRDRYARNMAFLREALRKQPRQREKNELFVVNMLERRIKEQRNELKGKYPALTKDTEIKAIMKAVRSSVLELHTFQALQIETLAAVFRSGETPNEHGVTPSAEAIHKEYMDIVSAAVTSGATYPMFDDTTGRFVDARHKEEGKFPSEISMQRARHSALAANLLERLPDFGLTPIDEILDIRKELRDPLDRFRGGVSTYAAGIKSAPWNKDFAAEADELFIQKVQPGILEVEDSVKSGSNPISHIWKEAVKAQSLIGGGTAIGFVVDTPDSLPKYVRMALGAVLPLAFAAGEGINSYKNEKRRIKSHTLYFYYRLRDRVKQ